MPRISEEVKSKRSDEFQKRIKEIIEDSELNNKDFAGAVGVSKEVIGRATGFGIIPSVKSLIKIADYVQCSITYLLGEKDSDDFIPADNAKSFHERLEILANEKGVKYSQISHSMTFAPNAIYEWIRTSSLPALEYLRQLAKYFNVSIDYLLGRTDYKD